MFKAILHSHTHCQAAQADTQAKSWQRMLPVQPYRHSGQTTPEGQKGSM